MNFSDALIKLKSGLKICRQGWNGKDMWLILIKEYRLPELDIHLRNGLLPFIGMKTANDGFVPWLASQTDILAVDWVIVT